MNTRKVRKNYKKMAQGKTDSDTDLELVGAGSSELGEGIFSPLASRKKVGKSCHAESGERSESGSEAEVPL